MKNLAYILVSLIPRDLVHKTSTLKHYHYKHSLYRLLYSVLETLYSVQKGLSAEPSYTRHIMEQQVCLSNSLKQPPN
jgi:hypothetical protein